MFNRAAMISDMEESKPTTDQFEMQSLLLDQVQLALIVRDLEDRICFWNKGAERLYGWRADEVTGENVYELLFPRELQGIEEKERVLAETGEWAGELRQVTKTQTTIVVESRWKLRRDESGKPKSVLMVNKRITYDVAVRPHLTSIAGNAAQLCQLLLNLGRKARRAMPGGGTLMIEATNAVSDKIASCSSPEAVPGEYVLLSVADTGDGISADIADRIFEPFFTTKNESGNTGLGLFAVAEIVKNHKGFINLSTEPKRGTRFLVYLPAEKRSD